MKKKSDSLSLTVTAEFGTVYSNKKMTMMMMTMMTMTKLKLLTAFLLLLATSNTCHGAAAALSVDLNLDFVSYTDDTDCNPDPSNQYNVSGKVLSVSVSKDGKQNNPDDGVYGNFCEETLYDNGLTFYTKIEITCQVATIGRFSYGCDESKDCSECAGRP
mmetsp:Transcript_10025/g.9689  ORF Transcript_10025/g.9689 Transcript_10025/m.9689 type:complete len:160 (-) Transcript_10025:383-862(-)